MPESSDIGQEAEVLSRLQEWIQALGDHQYRPMTVDGASAHLRTLLREKACLLVIDDAWDADHVRPFLVGSHRCRSVVTTRDAALARKVGAQLHDLDVLTEAQALSLFEARLGPLDGSRDLAAALARDLGYLPLAAELAAAQVERGCSWEELLAAFRRGLAELEALDLDEATHRNESLRLSFRLSLDRLPAGDLEAFEWLGVLPEDAVLVPAAAAVLWDRPEGEARRLLRRLRDLALLKGGDGEGYTVHDLLHDEARLRLAVRLPLPEAHGALLARYRQRTRDGLWHTLPEDGYIHAHLAWHLVEAGQEAELHTLLREESAEGRNGWFEARERLGQTAGFLADVGRAWKAADEGADRDSGALGLGCRYALMVASVNSLAGNLPTELLVALVEWGGWQPAQALAYARQIPGQEQRTLALAALARHLTGELREEALAEALAAARAIGNEWARAEALAALAPYLTGELVAEGLAAARAIGDEGARARALAALAPQMAELASAVLCPLWKETLHHLAARTRRDVLSDLGALAPALVALGGQEAVVTTLRAVLDVGRWWP